MCFKGWLVKHDKKYVLMSDYNYNAKGEMGDGGNTTVMIPTKNVIKKFKIERTMSLEMEWVEIIM